VHRAFEAQARRTPERPAVVYAGRSLSYAELDARASRLAHHLRARGVGPESRVGLCLERGTGMLVGVLGILKAGGAYIPLDPTHPAGRLAHLVAESGIGTLVSGAGLRERLPFPAERVVDLDADRERISRESPAPPEGGAGPGNAAYVIHTSGSTGRPKGVAVPHAAVLQLAAALEEAVYRGREGLRVSLNAPLVFDGSVKQWIQLLRGHTLHVVPERERTRPEHLLAWIRDSRVEVLDCTPTVLRGLLAAGLGERGRHAPALILSGGEALDPATWTALAALPGTRTCNLYGPTEFTVDATAGWVHESPEPTLGRPLAGTGLCLLDAGLAPVPDGESGEIYLAGERLARGYLGRPDLTAERFLPDPFAPAPGGRMYRTGDLARRAPDGTLHFLGRADDQVQIRGVRVEPGEVAALLREHPAVRDAAVTAREDGRGGPRLAAYVVPRSPSPSLRGELRGWLRERCPEHMVPALWTLLEALPVTRNGKLDWAALPTPGDGDAGEPYLPLRTPTEAALAGIWAEVLGVARVGAGDNFFDRGGDSLLLVQMHARVGERLTDRLSVPDLFQFRTLAEMARRVDALRESPEPQPQESYFRAGARRARAALQRAVRAGVGTRNHFKETEDEQRG
ncbi:MAG TPA: non-ribosomal peptide synthetase, partial [Longimicrobiaceae bacterium]|nr:non-ribosomal peptide synthetase [Longimicrobiaceae bacterium]